MVDVILSLPEILLKKRNGEELLEDELKYFVDCICKKEIDRSQVSDGCQVFDGIMSVSLKDH